MSHLWVGEASGGSWSRPRSGRPGADGHPTGRKLRWEIVAGRARGAAMIREDRLRFRLRFPALYTPSGDFPCTGAAFASGCAADIYTSANKCSQSRPLPKGSLRAVRPIRRDAPFGRGTSAVGCAFHFPVTERGAVLSADRVVAGRRCLIVPARLARPDTPIRCRCAIVGKGCTIRPSLSRRTAGRCCNGPAARRPGGAR
jgi:hypothetical protein